MKILNEFSHFQEVHVMKNHENLELMIYKNYCIKVLRGMKQIIIHDNKYVFIKNA